MPIDILWPTFALVGWIYAIWFLMYVQRFGLMKRTPPRRDDFATMEAGRRYFAPVEMPAANLINLFEMPVLYFALVPLLLVTHHANHIQARLPGPMSCCARSTAWCRSWCAGCRFASWSISCRAECCWRWWVGFAADIAWPR